MLGASREFEIVLSAAGIEQTVTVTRSPSRIEETPESVIAIGRQEIVTTTGAQTLDDRLRQVPGFSLFRRAGSRTANPTTQGVSLRGVGASGASRALVLLDGVPLNDPFGGWIYWGRVPSQSISQVEILRGPAGDLYGSSAVGGVVSITTRRPSSDPMLDLEASYGTHNSPFISAYTSAGRGDWFGSLAAEAFRTDGYVVVDERFRGPVDRPANVRRLTVAPRVERQLPGRGGRIYAEPSYYEERRANGTPLQNNDTRIRALVLGGRLPVPRAGTITARAFASEQSYHQSFSAVAAGTRASEALTRLQSSPSQAVGAGVQWTAVYAGKFAGFAGADGREVRGRSDEIIFANSAATSLTSAGGREFAFGVYAGGTWLVAPRVMLGGGLRYDRWRNFDGYSSARVLRTGITTTTTLDERSESALSPRASVLIRVTKNISLAASVRLGFRQPTLNELYRSFRVGDVLTLANSNLRAERAAGGEGGVIVTANSRRTYLRADAFCTEITRNIANVTLSVTPTLTTRQRQNLGRTRSCGFEADAQHRFSESLSISAGYLFADPRVRSFPANPALEGRLIPQTPRHQFTAQMSYADARIVTVGVQLRASGLQYEDDLNQLPLDAYATIDAIVSRRVAGGVEIFAAAENLFDARIESGRTPVPTIAGRREIRFGIRLRLGR